MIREESNIYTHGLDINVSESGEKNYFKTKQEVQDKTNRISDVIFPAHPPCLRNLAATSITGNKD